MPIMPPADVEDQYVTRLSPAVILGASDSPPKSLPDETEVEFSEGATAKLKSDQECPNGNGQNCSIAFAYVLEMSRRHGFPLRAYVNGHNEITNVSFSVVSRVVNVFDFDSCDGQFTKLVELKDLNATYYFKNDDEKACQIQRDLTWSIENDQFLVLSVRRSEIIATKRTNLANTFLASGACLKIFSKLYSTTRQMIPDFRFVSRVSEEDSKKFFDWLAGDTGGGPNCDPMSPNNSCIPFKFPDNGCEARAHEACRKIFWKYKGVTCRKLWIYGMPLHVKSANAPFCMVGWTIHVAPFLLANNGEKMVLDPAIANAPLREMEWIEKVMYDLNIQTSCRNPNCSCVDPKCFYLHSVVESPAVYYLRSRQGNPGFDFSFRRTKVQLDKYRAELCLRAYQDFPAPPYSQCPH